jgi:hypothetical protein
VPKLQAFRDKVLAGGAAPWPSALDDWWKAWNGLSPWPRGGSFPWDLWPAWAAAADSTGQALSSQASLAEALLAFVAGHRLGG